MRTCILVTVAADGTSGTCKHSRDAPDKLTNMLHGHVHDITMMSTSWFATACVDRPGDTRAGPELHRVPTHTLVNAACRT